MTDREIKIQEVAGHLTLILLHGTDQEKQEVAALIREVCPDAADQLLATYGL